MDKLIISTEDFSKTIFELGALTYRKNPNGKWSIYAISNGVSFKMEDYEKKETVLTVMNYLLDPDNRNGKITCIPSDKTVIETEKEMVKEIDGDDGLLDKMARVRFLMDLYESLKEDGNTDISEDDADIKA